MQDMQELTVSKRRELTTQEKHAAMLWVDGVDLDGTETKTLAEIAKASGMTYQQFLLLRRREEWLEEVDRRLNERKKDCERLILKNLPDAVDRLVDIMQTGSEREARQAATTLLGIGGLSERRAVDVNFHQDETGVVRGRFGREELPDLTTISIDEDVDNAET